jgi:hypothetical protein
MDVLINGVCMGYSKTTETGQKAASTSVQLCAWRNTFLLIKMVQQHCVKKNVILSDSRFFGDCWTILITD